MILLDFMHLKVVLGLCLWAIFFDFLKFIYNQVLRQTIRLVSLVLLHDVMFAISIQASFNSKKSAIHHKDLKPLA